MDQYHYYHNNNHYTPPPHPHPHPYPPRPIHNDNGNNICPSCSHSHFPFCPPRYPPPPRLHHDPTYLHPSPPPRPTFHHPSPIHNNNNSDYYYEGDFRSSKRLRIDDGGPPVPPPAGAGGYHGNSNNYSDRPPWPPIEHNNNFNRHEYDIMPNPNPNPNPMMRYEYDHHHHPSQHQFINSSNSVRPPSPPQPMPSQGHVQYSEPRQQGGGYYSNNNYHHGNVGHYDVRPPPPPLPPLPASPPPPLPKEPMPVPSLFPITSSSPNVTLSLPPPPPLPMPSSHLHNAHVAGHSSRGGALFRENSEASLTPAGGHYERHYERKPLPVPAKASFAEQLKKLDISHLFKPPHRATRPDHFVIILRGLPGSGKSYLAKMLRDLEVEHGGSAPRIHSMDDYFMTEVEKDEENETSKSSGRGKKHSTKTVLEYCYEPEMEEAYRSSMLKSFKKTLEEGVFTIVIVDDRNLRVADFAQFWATAKRSGYEVYVLEAPYKDPAGCAARNVHGFTYYDVESMAAKWEAAPSLYLQLDVKSLFHGDDLKDGNIQEVDMETEDGDFDGGLSSPERTVPDNVMASSVRDTATDGFSKVEKSWDTEGGNGTEIVKDLGSSKWSDLDKEDEGRTKVPKGTSAALSGLLTTYGKEDKSVHWGDQGAHAGFSIGAVKKARMVSLVIGPGAGYNWKTNPLPDEEAQMAGKAAETKKHRVFQERLRAESQSFKAVFDRRQHRIGGFDAEEE